MSRRRSLGASRIRSLLLSPTRDLHRGVRTTLRAAPRKSSLLDFEHAYDTNLPRVYGFFAYRVSNRDDAEDLTQQTFERALNAWDQYDARKAAMGTWLMAIARNLLIDHYRARPAGLRQVPIEDVHPSELPSVDGNVQQSLGLEPELAQALTSLPDRDREIIALRYGADLTGPEIATLTNLSLANVQQIISRSLRKLKTALDK